MKKAALTIATVIALLAAPALAFLAVVLATNGALGGVPAAAASALVASLAWWALTRRTPRARTRLILAAPAVVVALLAAYVCIPVASTHRTYPPPSPLAATQFWDLPTGSRIAFWHLPARLGTPRRSAPIVFVHGGPGGYAGEHNRRFLAGFTESGYDVWVYDQAGGGSSGLLPERDYSHERNVADLAAVLDEIGAPQVLLITQSYGALIAASALADPHLRSRIAKVAFVEPGAYDYTVMNRFTEAEFYGGAKPNGGARVQTGSVLLQPRILLGALLPVGNRFLGQEEATNAYAPELRAQRLGSICLDNFDRVDAAEAFPVGLNLKANLAINNRGMAEGRSLREPLASSTVPIMVMLGECSYVGRPLQTALITDYPVVDRVQYMRGVGHAVWDGLDDHDPVARRALLEFFDGVPPTIPDYPTRAEVADFLHRRL